MSEHRASSPTPQPQRGALLSLALLACVLLLPGRSLAGQSSGMPGTGAASSGTASSGTSGAGTIRRVMIPPAATRVQGATAQSTAASRAGHAPVPLTDLPEFTVQDAAGRTLSSTKLAPARPRAHWVLLLTRNSCAQCDSILTALGASSISQLHEAGRLTVVVRPHRSSEAPAALDQARSVSTNLSNASLSADASGAAMTALHLSSTPVLLLMEGAHVHATLHGTLGDPARVAGLAAAWVTHEPAAPNAKPALSSAASTVAVATQAETH